MALIAELRAARSFTLFVAVTTTWRNLSTASSVTVKLGEELTERDSQAFGIRLVGGLLRSTSMFAAGCAEGQAIQL